MTVISLMIDDVTHMLRSLGSVGSLQKISNHPSGHQLLINFGPSLI